jgi:L-ascorbate metabolism protein UlaG (beta-lactamase superfamily)
MRFLIFILILLILPILIFMGFPSLTHPAFEPFTSYVLPSLPSNEVSLHARFIGTTTIQIDDGDTAIMIDGFFSRPGVIQLATSWLVPSLFPLLPNESIITSLLHKIDLDSSAKLAAILVAHSHHDHAMDSAFIAKFKDAELFGSLSVANIARSQNVPGAQIHILERRDEARLGRFQVEFFASPHSPDAWNSGEITDHRTPPVKINDYKDGRNYSFLLRHEWGTVLVHPSANFKRGLYENIKADVVFLSVGALGKQPECFIRDYWHEVVRATHAKLVIPIHWDDFSRSLDEPLLPMPYPFDDFSRSIRLLLKMSEEDEIPVRFLQFFDKYDIIRTATQLQ